MTTISVYSFLLLSILSMFFRPDFFNVITMQLTLSIGSLLFFIKQLDIPLNFRIITAGIIISQFYDIFWLWNFFSVSYM